MSRRPLVFSLVLVAGIALTCGEEDSNGSGGGGGGGEPLDWFESSCDDLGGVSTPAGACFIGCLSADDCPLDR